MVQFSNRTGLGMLFEDARAYGIVWTSVYLDFLIGTLDACAIVNWRWHSFVKGSSLVNGGQDPEHDF